MSGAENTERTRPSLLASCFVRGKGGEVGWVGGWVGGGVGGYATLSILLLLLLYIDTCNV